MNTDRNREIKGEYLRSIGLETFHQFCHRHIFRHVHIIATAVVLAAMSSIAPANAAMGDVTAPTPSLVRDLIEWIGENTHYDISPTLLDPPSISFCSNGQTIEYEGRTIVVDKALRAAYDLPHRRIFLVRPWNADNTFNVSTLLHELVHDVQFRSRHWPCMQRAEWEAYKLQDAWLREHGVKIGFDWFHIFAISRCPRDIHPK